MSTEFLARLLAAVLAGGVVGHHSSAGDDPDARVDVHVLLALGSALFAAVAGALTGAQGLALELSATTLALLAAGLGLGGAVALSASSLGAWTVRTRAGAEVACAVAAGALCADGAWVLAALATSLAALVGTRHV
jgi:hypothetical protein